VSRGVVASEDEQRRCGGTETAIGLPAYDAGTNAVRKLFGSNRKRSGLTYDDVVEGMTADDDKTAKAAAVASYAVTSPALAKAAEQPIRPYSDDTE
jgi:hypothetical protein